MDVALALRIALALAVICATLLGFRYVVEAGLRRRIAEPGGRLLSVIETTHLPSATSLHVIRIGDAYAVVARSAGYVAKIADLSPETVANRFASRKGSRDRLPFSRSRTSRPDA